MAEPTYIWYVPALTGVLNFGKISALKSCFNCLWYCDLNPPPPPPKEKKRKYSTTFSCLIRFWHLAGRSYKSSWTQQITLSWVYFLALEWIEILWSAMHSLVMYNLLLDGSCFRCFYWSVAYFKHLDPYKFYLVIPSYSTNLWVLWHCLYFLVV